MAKKERVDYGRENQTVTPAYRVTKTRDDGKQDTVFGKKDGGAQHGHSVRNTDGSIDYSRTIGGNVIKDSKKDEKPK